MSGSISFGEPHFDEEEESRVLAVLRSRWIGQGPVVAEFEQAFARYVEAPRAVTLSSCTAALQLSLLAAGIGPGDEVITTPFTFVATINAIDHVGATPVVVDIDRDTLAITSEAAAAAVTDRTRGVMPVHFGGLPVDVEGFDRLVGEHDLWLVEDAAHAVGAVAAGRPVGAPRHERHLTCFSFYPNKNLASAEGGAVTGGDPLALERIARLRLHGLDNDAWARFTTTAMSPVSMAVEAGHKFNWTDLQAAVGLAQLSKLEGFLAVREALAQMYADAFAASDPPGVRLRVPPPASLRTRHSLHLLQVEVEGGRARRDAILTAMRARGIGVAIHYIAAHLHPAHQGRWSAELPEAEWASDSLLSLPLHPGISSVDVDRIVAELVAVATGT